MKKPIEARLLEQVVVSAGGELPHLTESAWIDVVQQMDVIYADLLRYEVDLEHKNQRLEDAQDFIAGVLSSISDVLVVCDSKGMVLQVNRAFAETLGCGEEALLQQSLLPLFSADAREPLQRFLDTQGAEPITDREMSLLGQAGEILLAVTCSARTDSRRRFRGMVLIGRPIGELRKAYEALRSAHQELKRAQQQIVHSEKLASLGRLIAGVAHELNNPISYVYANLFSLKEYIERLKDYIAAIDRGPPNANLARHKQSFAIDSLMADLDPLLDATLSGAERVGEIVKDLRRYSSMQRDEHRPVKLDDVVRTATHWALRGVARAISIEIDIPADLEFMGYENHIHQVIVNIVQNAYCALLQVKEPVLRIDASAQGAFIVLRFGDNGPGIAETDLPRIFDPFFTTKEVGQGTGLGLSICEAIIRDHGGSITATNEPAGGALFEIRLPALNSMQASA